MKFQIGVRRGRTSAAPPTRTLHADFDVMGSAIGRGLIRHNAPDAIHSQQVTQREVEAVDDDPSLPHRPLKKHRWSGQAGTAVDTDGYSSISEYSSDHFAS